MSAVHLLLLLQIGASDAQLLLLPASLDKHSLSGLRSHSFATPLIVANMTCLERLFQTHFCMTHAGGESIFSPVTDCLCVTSSCKDPEACVKVPPCASCSVSAACTRALLHGFLLAGNSACTANLASISDAGY